MRQVGKDHRLIEECPECFTRLDNTSTSIYICATDDEALHIAAILGKSIIATVAGSKPRRIHTDGTFTRRDDITTKEGSDFWWTGNGLRLTATRITWGKS